MTDLNENDFRRLLTHEATLDSLIGALEAPIDWDAAYEKYIDNHSKMGVYGFPMMKQVWVPARQREHARKLAAAERKLAQVRAERIAAAMEELGDDYDHYSIRYAGQHGFGTPNVCVYRKDRSSPTGCQLFTSAPDSPEVRAAVGASRNDYEGARRGNLV